MSGPEGAMNRLAQRLVNRLRWAGREFAEGLAYFGVCYGHLPPYGWRPSGGRPHEGQPYEGQPYGRRLPLDEPPPGHPERLVPAGRPGRIGRSPRRRRLG